MTFNIDSEELPEDLRAADAELRKVAARYGLVVECRLLRRDVVESDQLLDDKGLIPR